MTWRDKAFLFLLSMTVTPLTYAFSVSYLWYWFVSPLGLPSIGLAWAYGLGITLRMLTYTTDYRKVEEEDKLPWPTRVVGGFAIPAIMLGVGWIAHWFMEV